jgi:hypothetical protein
VLPAGEHAGPYSVIVGAYRLESLTRLPVVDVSGRAVGDHVALATVDLP